MDAAKELRTRLVLTQAAFATRINRTVPSINRYESQVEPREKALLPYAEIAIASGFDDLATIFRDALIYDLGNSIEHVINWRPDQSIPVKRSQLDKALQESLSSFISQSAENHAVVLAFLKFMSSENLQPIEEIARNGLKQVLLQQISSATKPKKSA